MNRLTSATSPSHSQSRYPNGRLIQSKQPPKRLTLSRQLLTGFGAALAIIGMATVSIAYNTLRYNLALLIDQRATTITRGVEFASEGVLEIGEFYLLERIVQNYATLPAVLEVTIVDPNGVIVAHSDEFELHSISSRRYLDLYPELNKVYQEAARTGTETSLQTHLHGKSVIIKFLPFSSTLFNSANSKYALGTRSPLPPNRRGVAIAMLDLEQIEAEVNRSSLSSVLMITGSAGLMLLCMAGLIRKLVLSPLADINAAIAQRDTASQDNQSTFVLPPLPNNEIGFLGQTFAKVFDQLTAYQQLELDIAERKYAAIAQRYEVATHAAKVWVWDWDIHADAFWVDRSLQTWCDLTETDFPCSLQRWIEQIYVDDRDQFLNNLMAHVDGHSPEFICEYRLMDGQGNLHWFLSRGQVMMTHTPMPSDLSRLEPMPSDVQRAIGTITDIAERKQVEAQLRLSNDELARATRMKDEFLANMSHELRTPLNAILGMTEAIEDGVFGTVTPPQIKALQTIDRSGSHLLELINDILDIAKVESGQLVLNPSPTSIAAVCQSSVSFIKQLALKKQITVSTRIPVTLPDVSVDERRIRQVLINLLNNAVKFTPEGGQVTLEVLAPDALATRHPDATGVPVKQGYLRILVSDTGIGIDPDNIDKLFQPFIQIDSALNRQYDGTGLGLALVKRLVELHGGQVQLTSQVGVGSQFAIDLPYIPVAEVTADPVTQVLPQPPIIPTVDQERAPCILLVEDNAANVNTVSSYLRAKGYQLRVAHDGLEAIALTQTYHPDLILMDIQLPGMDGLEAIRRIRQLPQDSDIPILALTALAMEGDRELCLAAGADGYLTKPLRLKELAQQIHRVMERQSVMLSH